MTTKYKKSKLFQSNHTDTLQEREHVKSQRRTGIQWNKQSAEEYLNKNKDLRIRMNSIKEQDDLPFINEMSGVDCPGPPSQQVVILRLR